MLASPPLDCTDISPKRIGYMRRGVYVWLIRLTYLKLNMNLTVMNISYLVRTIHEHTPAILVKTAHSLCAHVTIYKTTETSIATYNTVIVS